MLHITTCLSEAGKKSCSSVPSSCSELWWGFEGGEEEGEHLGSVKSDSAHVVRLDVFT